MNRNQVTRSLSILGIGLASYGCSGDVAAPTVGGSLRSTGAGAPTTGADHAASPSLEIARLFPARHGDSVRSALAGDPMAPTQAELLAGGYPRRPDPRAKPQAYERWLAEVSHEVRLIEPRLVQVPDHSGSIFVPPSGTYLDPTEETGSANCSAAEMRAPTGTVFEEVIGEWRVPNTTGTPPQNSYSATWVGLDGDGLPDLLQAGTEFDLSSDGSPTYYFWLQYLPFDTNQVAIWNGTLNAGDDVVVDVFLGGAIDGFENAHGDYAWFYMSDLTTNVSTGWFSRFYGSSASVFQGAEAEAVVERPLINGQIPSLAPFGRTLMTYFSADYQFYPEQYYTWDDAPNFDNVAMYGNGSALLSYVYVYPTINTVQFLWNGYE